MFICYKDYNLIFLSYPTILCRLVHRYWFVGTDNNFWLYHFILSAYRKAQYNQTKKLVSIIAIYGNHKLKSFFFLLNVHSILLSVAHKYFLTISLTWSIIMLICLLVHKWNWGLKDIANFTVITLVPLQWMVNHIQDSIFSLSPLVRSKPMFRPVESYRVSTIF